MGSLSLLQDLDWRVGCNYIDGIIVGSISFEEHLNDLVKFFERLQAYKLKVKLSKCQFFRSKLLFLGHEISGNGIQPDPRKIEAISNMQPPVNISGL